MHQKAPSHIDRYQIIEILGRGAQGTVYLARDPSVGHHVALKLLSPTNSSGIARSRFLREFTAVSRLSHSSIVAVYEQGIWDSLPFFTMEYVAGTTIARHAVSLRRDTVSICRLMSSVADGLAYTHMMGVIHRDLKPANILIDRSGVPKISDFGMAKPLHSSVDLTQTTSIVGTMNYISPEILRNDQIDPRSDLYSFGIILFELLTGTLPFQSDSMIHLAMLHLSAPPPLLSSRIADCPSELEALVSTLLSKDPWTRPATAEIIADNLRRIADDQERRTVPEQSKTMIQGPPLVARFIGRESECASLLNTVPDTGSIPFSIRIVRGNGGIGKSRLIREALKRIDRRDVRIIRLPSIPIGALPFETIEELFMVIVETLERNPAARQELSDLFVDLPLISPCFNRIAPHSTLELNSQEVRSGINFKQKFRSIGRIIAHLTRSIPWVIVLEDLQNADSASLNFLDTLLTRSEAEEIHCTIWCSVRVEDVNDSSAFSSIASKWESNARVENLELVPLSYQESCKLVASMIHQSVQSADSSKLVSCGQGSPMILVETIRSHAIRGHLIPCGDHWQLNDPQSDSETLIPASLRDILKNRIDNLLPETLDTLSWAALLDPDIDFDVLKFTDTGPEEQILMRLNRLISHRFLEVSQNEQRESYRFCHHQLRNVLIEMLGEHDVKNRHRDIAMVLQTMPEGSVPSYRIARHLEAAKQWIDAIRFWGKACCDASAEHQELKAIEYGSRAESIFEQHGADLNRAAQRVRSTYLPAYINNLYQRSEFQKVISVCHATRDVLKSNLTPKSLARLRFDLIVSCYMTGAIAEGDAESRVLLESIPHSEAMVWIYKANVFRGVGQSKPRESFAALMNLKRFMRSLGKTENFSWNRFMVAHTLVALKRFTIAEKLFRMEYERAVESKNLDMQACTLSGLGALKVNHGEMKDAEGYIRKALEIHRKMGEEYWISCDLHDLALIAQTEGRYSEALPMMEESLEFCLRRWLPREAAISVQNLCRLHSILNGHDFIIRIIDRFMMCFPTYPVTSPLLLAFENRAVAQCMIGQSDRASKVVKQLFSDTSGRYAKGQYCRLRLLLIWSEFLIHHGHLHAGNRLIDHILSKLDASDSQSRYGILLVSLNRNLMWRTMDEISRLLGQLAMYDLSTFPVHDLPCTVHIQSLARAFQSRSLFGIPEPADVVRSDGTYLESSVFTLKLMEWVASALEEGARAELARAARNSLRERIASMIAEDRRMSYLACEVFIPEWM